MIGNGRSTYIRGQELIAVGILQSASSLFHVLNVYITAKRCDMVPVYRAQSKRLSPYPRCAMCHENIAFPWLWAGTAGHYL